MDYVNVDQNEILNLDECNSNLLVSDEPGVDSESWENEELNNQALKFKQSIFLIKNKTKYTTFLFKCKDPLDNLWCLYSILDGVVAKIRCDQATAIGNKITVYKDNCEHIYHFIRDETPTDKEIYIVPDIITLFNKKYIIISGDIDDTYFV